MMWGIYRQEVVIYAESGEHEREVELVAHSSKLWVSETEAARLNAENTDTYVYYYVREFKSGVKE